MWQVGHQPFEAMQFLLLCFEMTENGLAGVPERSRHFEIRLLRQIPHADSP